MTERKSGKSRKGSAQSEEGEEENLGTQLYDNFMEWMEDYTVHGCPNISKAKYTITRILWVIVVLAMISYLLYSKMLLIDYIIKLRRVLIRDVNFTLLNRR